MSLYLLAIAVWLAVVVLIALFLRASSIISADLDAQELRDGADDGWPPTRPMPEARRIPEPRPARAARPDAEGRQSTRTERQAH